MATRSVIDIDVNDAAFQKFSDQFKVYQDQLSKSGAAWQKVTDEIDGSRESFDKLVEAAGIRLAKTQLLATAEKTAADQLDRAAGNTDRQAKSWHSMAKDAHSFGLYLKDATTSLLRWGSLTGVLSGILGAGGLFGIDRLATSAAGQRQTSFGLGVSPGDKNAFDVAFSQVSTNPDNVLSSVNDALTDPTKSKLFSVLGLNYRAEQGKGTADASVDVLKALQQLAKRTDTRYLGTTYDAYGLGDSGLSKQEFQALHNRPEGDFEDFLKTFADQRATLTLTQDQTRAWEKLKIQLMGAGLAIETYLIKDLAALAEPLKHLSEQFVQVVGAFANGPKLKELMDEIGGGFDAIAKDLATPEFSKAVVKFSDDVVSLVEGLGELSAAVAGTVKSLAPKGDGSSSDTVKTIENALGGAAFGLLFGGLPGAVAGGVGGWYGSELGRWLRQQWDDLTPANPNAPNGVPRVGPTFGTPGMIPGAYQPSMQRPAAIPAVYRPVPAGGGGSGEFASIEAQYGLPAGLLESVSWTESHNNPNAVSPAGAQGRFQFMPATARRYNLDNPFDALASADAAGRYYRDLLKEFHGNVEEALAGYNWGEGNVERDLKQFGDRWKEHLPRETADYIKKVTSGMQAPDRHQPYGHKHPDRSMQVRIDNNTGGSVNVTARQLYA